MRSCGIVLLPRIGAWQRACWMTWSLWGCNGMIARGTLPCACRSGSCASVMFWKLNHAHNCMPYIYCAKYCRKSFGLGHEAFSASCCILPCQHTQRSFRLSTSTPFVARRPLFSTPSKSYAVLMLCFPPQLKSVKRIHVRSVSSFIWVAMSLYQQHAVE